MCIFTSSCILHVICICSLQVDHLYIYIHAIIFWLKNVYHLHASRWVFFFINYHHPSPVRGEGFKLSCHFPIWFAFGETTPPKKNGPTYVQLSKLMIINVFLVLVMFKGGRFWTLHLADLGLMTMLQVADMVWEFPFNWYLRLISGKSWKLFWNASM